MLTFNSWCLSSASWEGWGAKEGKRSLPTCQWNTFPLLITFTPPAPDSADKATVVTTSLLSCQHPLLAPTALGITCKLLHLAHLDLRPWPWPPVQQGGLTCYPHIMHATLSNAYLLPTIQAHILLAPWSGWSLLPRTHIPLSLLLCQAIHFPRLA